MVGTTMAVIMLAGMAVSAYSTYKAGKKAEEAAKAEGTHAQEASNSQADLADSNAAIADLQAQDAVARGAEDESRFRTQIRGSIGAERAGIAAGNIDVSYGSAVDVQADAAYLGELDALQLRTNAKREAWGFEVQADDLRKRATIARKEGTYQAAAGNAYESGKGLAIASGLIGGGASLLSMRYGFGRASGAR
jgi:hypothetical protein